MESHEVNHDEHQTGECHSSTLERRFNEMKAANEAQNARFNKFSRRMEQEVLDLNTALYKPKHQRREKETLNIVMQVCLQKIRSRTSVKCLQQETCGARALVECPSAQGSSGARTSADCPTEQRQVSKLFSDSTSDTNRMVLVLKI